jgi:hypothetical protein
VTPARAGAVKVGRRTGVDTRSDISRPHLDRPEHGGRMVCTEIDRLLLVATLVVDWGEIAERGVAPARIVEALDELEDGNARFGLCL